jgi:CubicO group peptidase (beta-lactamase class C family)
MSDVDQPPSSVTRRSAVAHLGVAALGLGIPVVRRAPDPAMRDEEIERLLRLASVPSMSYALVDGDRITTRAIGVRRAGEAERVTADTVYAAASLTKAVVSYVLLGLVGEGALSLDRPVREYLPLPNPDDPRAGAITARRLLSHSGGWRNWRNNASQPLTADFEPGARWSYSGEGFFFLQRVAEKLTGKGIGQLARERVFEPLGMTRSSLVGLVELEPFQATGHNGRGEVTQPFGRPTLLELRRLATERGVRLDVLRTEDSEQAIRTAEPALPVLPNFLVPNAAASLLTTPNDFGRFLRHLVTARKAGGRPAAIVDLMMSPQIRCNEAVQWGLGVGIEESGGRRSAWQWGDNPGFKNFFLADTQNGKAMVVFTNGDRGARVYERVMRATLGEDHPAFLWA